MGGRIVILLALLAAGCLAPVAPDPNIPLPSVRDGLPTFQPPVTIAPITEIQGEFPLAVSADGQTILACTHGGFTGPAPKYVSLDGGATWRPVQPSPTPAASGDCWVDLGDDGTWYFVDSQVVGNTVSSSSDGGRTWIVNRLSTPPAGGTADRPYMVPLGGPRMGLSYVQDYLLPGYVEFTRTMDRGATWSPPVQVSAMEGEKTNVMHGPMLTGDDRSMVRIPLFRFRSQDFPSGGPGRGDLQFAVSRDGGLSWSREGVLASVEGLFTPPAAARTPGGVVYWAYQVRNGSTQEIRLLSSLDDGASWRPSMRISGGWDDVGYMWLDASPDGTATLSFDAEGSVLRADRRGEHVILIRLDARRDDPVVWAEPVVPASNAEFTVVAHDALGRTYVAYRHESKWLLLRERA